MCTNIGTLVMTCNFNRTRVLLQGYRKVSVLVQPQYLGTCKLDPVPLAVVTSASSKPFALPNLVQFPPSITSITDQYLLILTPSRTALVPLFS